MGASTDFRRRQSLPRVLFVIGSLRAGGSEGQLVELMTREHTRRVEAVLVTFSPASAGSRQDRVDAAGVRHLTLGRLDGPTAIKAALAAFRLDRLLRSERPDAIYAWLDEAALLAVPLARTRRIPVIVARRNLGERPSRSTLMDQLVRRVEASANVVTVNSEAVLRRATARGTPSERLRMVRNGHESAASLPAPRGSEIALGYLSRFRPEKGHRRFLDALERMGTTTPWRAVLAGDGPLEEDIRSECIRRGLTERVRFLGVVSDSRAFWARCDVGVLLSDHEGCPNALIEAALAGRPLVATAVGGNPEVVVDGAGFLLAPDDVGGIAHALERLVEDRDLRARLGSVAHMTASRRFELSRSLDGHVAAIHAALGQQHSGSTA